MDEPQKSQILDSFKIFGTQFEQSALRAKADLMSGLPLEDLIIAAGRNYKETMTADELAFALSCCVLRAAKKVRPARKATAVVAKRPRATKVEVVDE
jgi:hypothetical protein